jgi:hypothetical protein
MGWIIAIYLITIAISALTGIIIADYICNKHHYGSEKKKRLE